jgi:hypothetical protein
MSKSTGLTREQVLRWFQSVDDWVSYGVQHGADKSGAIAVRNRMGDMRDAALLSLESRERITEGWIPVEERLPDDA